MKNSLKINRMEASEIVDWFDLLVRDGQLVPTEKQSAVAEKLRRFANFEEGDA